MSNHPLIKEKVSTLFKKNMFTQLSIKNASWSEPKGKQILHPISFELNQGRVLGIVGPNGAGKSTLLRLIYRYRPPTSGYVTINGINIWSIPAHKFAQLVGVVLQEQPADFTLTVKEIVTLGRTPYNSGFAFSQGAFENQIVQGALDKLHLSEFADRRLETLSGGERQRVMVARALAQEPLLLVLDEPTNHLYIRHQLELLTLIRDLPITIVTSFHDLNMAARVCDDVLLLKAGHSLGFGRPDTVFSETTVSEAFCVKACQERLVPSNQNHLTFQL